MSEEQKTSKQKVTVDQWLADHRFSRGNPFAKTSADEERDQLQEDLFVSIAPYDEIRGNQTRLVFAPRGGGKSALRLRLASIALPRQADTDVLAVEVTDWGWLVRRYRENGAITADDYADFLIPLATSALWASYFPIEHMNTAQGSRRLQQDKQHRENRALKTTNPGRADIATLLRHFVPHELSASALYKKLAYLESAFAVDWSQFKKAVNQQQLRILLAETCLGNDPIAILLADVVDEIVEKPAPDSSLLQKFGQLVKTANTSQIHSIHFLLDRLDEMQLLTDNPETQAALLAPLLHELQLHDLVVFKYFLPQELRNILSVRWDRLEDKTVHIQWNRELLKELLDGRLKYFSDEKVNSLTQLCAEGSQEIENSMLRLASGSPRRLLVTGQTLCQIHVNSITAEALLNKQDWEDAKSQILQSMPPIIQLYLNRRTVVVSGKEVALTKTEAAILRCLTVDGCCSREELIETVWGPGSDQAADAAFSRLRKKLGDTGKEQVYLQTIRGAFRLQYYELLD